MKKIVLLTTMLVCLVGCELDKPHTFRTKNPELISPQTIPLPWDSIDTLVLNEGSTVSWPYPLPANKAGLAVKGLIEEMDTSPGSFWEGMKKVYLDDPSREESSYLLYQAYLLDEGNEEHKHKYVYALKYLNSKSSRDYLIEIANQNIPEPNLTGITGYNCTGDVERMWKLISSATAVEGLGILLLSYPSEDLLMDIESIAINNPNDMVRYAAIETLRMPGNRTDSYLQSVLNEEDLWLLNAEILTGEAPELNENPTSPQPEL